MVGLLVSASVLANVHVYESKRDAITEGDAVLHCDPDSAYRAATDYGRWREIFRGVRAAMVKAQHGAEAHVTFLHDDGTRDVLHFKNQPATRTVWFEQLGGDAEVWCQIAFQPGQQPGTTRVHTWFYADVHGAKSWFVSDDEIRKLRQQQVRDDLSQLVTYFSRR